MCSNHNRLKTVNAIKELHSLNNTERKYNIHLKLNETMSNDLKAKPVILLHVYRYIFYLISHFLLNKKLLLTLYP